jgi:hypothetical protein
MRIKLLSAAIFLMFSIICGGQIIPGKLSFALPEHSGRLSLDQGNFKVVELSAKTTGSEFGVRAKDGDMHFLGFLFLWPEKPHLTSEACREEMLKSEGAASLAAAQSRLTFKSKSGSDVAMVLMIPADGKTSTVRAFVASGDLCGDLSFTYEQPITVKQFPMAKAKAILDTIQFDPQATPTFREAFAYATVNWDHHQLAGAASAYKAALKLVGSSDDPTKWRRVTTDQLSMALGMSGDVSQSRTVNEAAIELDPDYPMYYYDIACADAEQGDAVAARVALQKAWERRKNTLPGEQFPNPANDDSIQKLKMNKEFWSYVQTLH